MSDDHKAEVREALADVLMSDGLREKPGMGRDYALNEADAILARFNVTERGGWEYGASWLEGDERVYMPTENDWRARVEVQRMNQGYEFPNENYVVRRHPASEWEAFDV